MPNNLAVKAFDERYQIFKRKTNLYSFDIAAEANRKYTHHNIFVFGLNPKSAQNESRLISIYVLHSMCYLSSVNQTATT